MAITRTQQAKQMLQYGGRIGLKPGGFTVKDDLREQAGRAITQGKKPPTMKEVREIVDSGPDRDTGLERARQRNIALQNKLLDTPYKAPETSIPSINLLGNLIGGVGYNKGIKFYSDNSIGVVKEIVKRKSEHDAFEYNYIVFIEGNSLMFFEYELTRLGDNQK